MSGELFFRDRMISINEAYTELIVCHLLALAEELPSDDWLKRAQNVWRTNLAGRGLGMTSLELDSVILSESDCQRMSKILNTLDRKIAEYGENIPAAAINAMKPPYTVFICDVSVSKVREIIDRIREMIDD